MPTIEKIFRCRIEYELENDSSGEENEIHEKAFELGSAADLEVEATSAGPSWSASILIEGKTESKTRKVAEKIERFIRSFEGAKIY